MTPRLYSDLAHWWPLMSPPSHYVEEAADLLPLLREARPFSGTPTLLELGTGGGSLAFHLKGEFALTLTDISEPMLAMNRLVNPECEHIAGDMRSLRLDRRFDCVLVHDAIMYATQTEDALATIRTAAIHCRPGGRVVVLPDFVKETFAPQTEHGGEDGTDGRGLRYVEWTWDPDPDDTTAVAAFAFLLRETDGKLRTEMDVHLFGLFPRQQWLDWFAMAGLTPRIHNDPWGRDVFVAAG